MSKKMKVACAWCGKDMDEKDGRGVEGTSHGICEECENKHFPEMTIPEPSAFKVRAELRKYPTSKLRELCGVIGSGQMTGIEILNRNRDHAISACKEILWERGKAATELH